MQLGDEERRERERERERESPARMQAASRVMACGASATQCVALRGAAQPRPTIGGCVLRRHMNLVAAAS
jgi:hypothetical protein